MKAEQIKRAKEFATAKLSRCITMMLEDIEHCEKNPRYKIGVGKWHRPGEGVCSIFMAGTIMAKTMGVDAMLDAHPSDFEREERNRFFALDGVAFGEVRDALAHMEEKPSGWANHNSYLSLPKKIKVAEYCHDPEQWKADMRRIRDMLRKVGF